MRSALASRIVLLGLDCAGAPLGIWPLAGSLRRDDDQRVVVKVTTREGDWSEAYLQHRCRCDDVLAVLDTFGSPFYNVIVMPAATCSLAGHMKITRTAATGLPTRETLAVVLGTARGLTRIHEAGVLHQDIHTGNVFVKVLGGGGMIIYTVTPCVCFLLRLVPFNTSKISLYYIPT